MRRSDENRRFGRVSVSVRLPTVMHRGATRAGQSHLARFVDW